MYLKTWNQGCDYGHFAYLANTAVVKFWITEAFGLIKVTAAHDIHRALTLYDSYWCVLTKLISSCVKTVGSEKKKFLALKTLPVFLNLAITQNNLLPISLLNISGGTLNYFTNFIYIWLYILVSSYISHIIWEFIVFLVFKTIFESIQKQYK